MINLSIIIPFNKINKILLNNINHTNKLIKHIDCEILYIFDGKIRDFKKIKKKFEAKSKKIKFYETKSKSTGPGIARNLGIKLSKGEKIIFLDVDDFLIIKNLKKLLNIKELGKYNLIYYNYLLLKKNIIKMNNQFLNYSKSNISDFLVKSSNNMVIVILFEKKFLIQNKIRFKKGIFEDIFFIFKSHYYNNKKILNFRLPVYKKINTKNSITNTLSKNHIKYMFLAYKDIHDFLKKSISYNQYKKLVDLINFRMRGQFYNEYVRIQKIKLIKMKNELINYTFILYKSYLKKEFTVKSKKDLLVKKIISNKSFVNVQDL